MKKFLFTLGIDFYNSIKDMSLDYESPILQYIFQYQKYVMGCWNKNWEKDDVAQFH